MVPTMGECGGGARVKVKEGVWTGRSELFLQSLQASNRG